MEIWSSRLRFILAAVGSAVGIGNIWRFSSVVGQNGGGAYLIPYLIAVFAFAIPLMILELAVGRHLRGNVVTAFGKTRKQFRIIGWLVCSIVFLILSYYLVITGWTLAYLVFSLMNLKVAFSEFTSSFQPVVYFVVSALATGIIVSLGVRRGIERVTSILIPASFLILVALALFSTTLQGFSAGMRFLFTPDFKVLNNPMIWSAAFGQAFFSLSVGVGILITYGSYLDAKTDIPRSSMVIAASDLMVSMLAGLIIFPLVFTFGLEPTIGAQLAFSTLSFLTLLIFLCTVSALLTNVLNNTTIAAVFVPILISVAMSTGEDPIKLVIPATLATTFGYSLPSASGRMALIAATGLITREDMLKYGILITLPSVAALVAMFYGMTLLGVI